MYIVRHRTLFFILTGLVLVAALGSIIAFGLPLGLDFKGGSLMQVAYFDGRPDLETIKAQVATVPVGEISVRALGESAVNIRTSVLTPEAHTAVLAALSGSGTTTELTFTSVGPSLGSQFANKALWALLAVVLAIVLYIAFAFRKVSRPVPSWCYGLTAVVILLHDLAIPAGFYTILGYFTGAEVDALFVTALLALLGYSVNDTIVIFDRVREHLRTNEKTGVREEFADTVGKSISETITRSINTSFTVALALIALVFVGAASTQNFALVLLVGVIAGTYSSILLAAPLLVPLSRFFTK
ncbi:protein-export membrane protein SecF [Candidatus Kaiserbacteria bacterium RIFCSPLOWO2_02_FULL_56_11]|nr:MAG: protein-export membrane protein SecF [Candidatus Kaiserbacteria bacterium RIFCSPLOWO2_02_FULL_56_11]